jgi:hypothetical protein
MRTGRLVGNRADQHVVIVHERQHASRAALQGGFQLDVPLGRESTRAMQMIDPFQQKLTQEQALG